jgi:glycosyltransferase involved in cell wall biosynthesis
MQRFNDQNSDRQPSRIKLGKIMSKIGVLLPAFNEEENIQGIIKETKNCLPNAEIIVVDDGSKDRTSRWARRAGAKVLKHEVNRGKGEAVRTGIKFFLNQSNADFVVIVDADGQYSIKEVPKLVYPLEHEDSTPFRHRVGNSLWRFCFNILLGMDLRDTNCGFIALNRNAMDKIRNIGGGYIIENELLIGALRNGLEIKQVPVSVKYMKKSGVFRGIKIVLSVLVFIISEGLRYRLSLN